MPKAPSSQGQYKNWCFTWQKDKGVFPKHISDAGCCALGISYLVYQPEKGVENGQEHVQGFFQVSTKKRLSTIKKHFGQMHLEPMQGTAQQCIDYCRKDETFFQFDGLDRYEHGVCSHQGARADIDELKELVVKKGGLKTIANEFPEAFLRYSRLERWGDLLRPSRENKPRQVLVYFGAPGTGKSRVAYRDFGDDMYTPCQNNSAALSFESYDQQQTILIDDFMPGNLAPGAIKTMTDRYPNKLPGRNISPENMADTIIFTSNLDPREWFPKDPTFWPALLRRSAAIIECTLSATGLICWTEIVSDGKMLAFPRALDVPEYE